MGGEYEGGGDRRARSREQIQQLVQSRTETLALLTALANSQPFTPNPVVEQTLQRFCQSLIDYTASAHFQLYRYLAENQERRRSVLAVADQLYPKIVETTDVILRFNDKYETASLGDCLDFLASDLSQLGECLADRIVFEDKIITALNGNLH
jgi:regulator of sigma D